MLMCSNDLQSEMFHLRCLQSHLGSPTPCQIEFTEQNPACDSGQYVNGSDLREVYKKFLVTYPQKSLT